MIWYVHFSTYISWGFPVFPSPGHPKWVGFGRCQRAWERRKCCESYEGAHLRFHVGRLCVYFWQRLNSWSKTSWEYMISSLKKSIEKHILTSWALCRLCHAPSGGLIILSGASNSFRTALIYWFESTIISHGFTNKRCLAAQWMGGDSTGVLPGRNQTKTATTTDVSGGKSLIASVEFKFSMILHAYDFEIKLTHLFAWNNSCRNGKQCGRTSSTFPGEGTRDGLSACN